LVLAKLERKVCRKFEFAVHILGLDLIFQPYPDSLVGIR